MDDYEKKIIELWNKGYSTAMIAAEVGKTKNMICGKVFRMREKGFDLSPRAEITKIKTETGKEKVAHRRLTMDQPLLGLVFKKKTEERVKPVVIIKDPPSAKPRNIKFKNLTSKSCRYVVNDGRPENFIFCGAPKERGPYCEAHALICYVQPKTLAKTQRNPNGQQRYYR